MYLGLIDPDRAVRGYGRRSGRAPDVCPPQTSKPSEITGHGAHLSDPPATSPNTRRSVPTFTAGAAMRAMSSASRSRPASDAAMVRLGDNTIQTPMERPVSHPMSTPTLAVHLSVRGQTSWCEDLDSPQYHRSVTLE
jgi:hypothetical protein